MKKNPWIASNSPPSPGRSQHVSEMRLEQEHFVPAQTGHQTHYLYRHLSMPMHLWPVHLHRLTAASLQELRNQCLTSKHNMCSSRHEQPPHKINGLHVLWMGSEIEQTGSVCVSVLVCFQTFFGTRRFILLNEYCPPSLAFQKDLACFCCLLCWHHFSEISKQPLATAACALKKTMARQTCLKLSSKSTSRTLL